jgi:5-formyltetrahydrofolate cyclo-ligase
VTLESLKAQARRSALDRRAGCDPAVGLALCRHFLKEVTLPARAVVAGFWPLDGEVDIRPLIHALHDRGHPIALPVTGRRGEALTFRAWNPGTALLPGRFGTSHPGGDERAPDVLLMPLLAFDASGNRLGYGGGFYDRTVAERPDAMRIGCAYAAQELDSVPTGPYDARLHAIATEDGVRSFPAVFARTT